MTLFRFGPFVVDRVGYRVLRDGAPLDLTPKLLDLLLFLLDHAGSLVTKEQFLDAEQAVAVLERSRPIEAALVRAQILAARRDDALAIATLDRMLDTSPPGFLGWTIPVEPFLKELHRTQGFAGILTRLAVRAR